MNWRQRGYPSIRRHANRMIKQDTPQTMTPSGETEGSQANTTRCYEVIMVSHGPGAIKCAITATEQGYDTPKHVPPMT